MTDEDALRKARTLKMLVERGSTEGERAAARNVLDMLLAKHPGIRAQLDAPAASDAPPPPPPPWGGAWGAPPPPPPSARPGGFRPSGRAEPPKPAQGGFMGSVWDFLQGAAESVREGLTLRDRLHDITDVAVTANTRTVAFRVAISVRDLEDLLNDIGTERDAEVATILASFLREAVISTLASMDIEDDEP